MLRNYFINNFRTKQNPNILHSKGIPIDGSLDSFVQKLKTQNLTYIGKENGVAIFMGEFAAYKDCTIGIVSLKQKDLVCKAAVTFPSCETWSSLSDNYFLQ